MARRPEPIATPSDDRSTEWRTMAAYSCLLGSVLTGLVAIMLVNGGMRVSTTASFTMIAVLLVLFCWLDWPGRARLISLIIAGMALGLPPLFPIFYIGFGVDFMAGLLGMILGLIALGPCWARRDRAGVAMCLIGCAGVPLVILASCRL